MKTTVKTPRSKAKKTGFPLPILQLVLNPKSITQQYISPWVWGFFILSLIICMACIFVTLNRPTLLPFQNVNPLELRVLPSFLSLPTNLDDIFIPASAIVAFCITLIFLPANNFTRLIVHTVISILAVRYLVWRATATLNTAHWLSVIVSTLPSRAVRIVSKITRKLRSP